MSDTPEALAVVGLAGRFPGAPDVATFWKNLCDGVESISRFTDEELLADGVDPALIANPAYVKAGGIVRDSDRFDAAFFGLSPREAALMDPQHRLFLECAWEALEHAGIATDDQPGRIGVYAGQSMNTWLLTNVYAHIAHVASMESLHAAIGNDKDSLTTEVAYRLNLRGPAVTIQSSSSTSLTAIHHACQALLAYECDYALAGGVSLHFPEKAGYLAHEGGTTSADGHCRPYDADADGFVSGHGAGVVLLRRLSDAIAAGDTIYAVVRGSAVNNDGSAKVSYMAPSVDGHAEVVALAQAVAGVDPDTVGYVEGHGTATAMGDPIELAALTQAFRQGTDAVGFCTLGSAKGNVGHLDTAAGVTGFIKATLALHHKTIPGTLHYRAPNPRFDLANSPFRITGATEAWPEGPTPRRAGVSSLGMGGTNAHLVLEEAPRVVTRAHTESGPGILVLSAKTDTALDAMAGALAEHLEAHPHVSLADASRTLARGRTRFSRRRALVAKDRADAIAALREPSRQLGGVATSDRPVMFLFSGQGSQYVDMGRGLCESEPVFRAEVDACARWLRTNAGIDLLAVLYPPADRRAAPDARLRETALTQPALFTIEHALAKLWMSLGIRPRALVGHSVGEFVAAVIAGVMSRDEALALVTARGRLMQAMPAGAMLAVSLPEETVAAMLPPELAIAAVNTPKSCVVAGPIPAIDAFAARLAADLHTTTRLHTSHAFHSPMMEPILGMFRGEVARVRLRAPTIPWVSNVTGTWITADEATSPDYWARHLRGAVRFADGVGELLREKGAILLEVGPGQTLATLSRQHPARLPDHVILASLRHPRETTPDVEFVRATLARLWVAGVEPDWDALLGDAGRRVPLPTYPFERQRHRVDPPARKVAQDPDARLPIERWTYAPAWRQGAGPARASWRGSEGAWWVLTPDGSSLGDAVERALATDGRTFVRISAGATTGPTTEGWTVKAEDPAAWDALLGALPAPRRIVHLWATDPATADRPGRGWAGLLDLARALERAGTTTPVGIGVVTSGAFGPGGAPDPDRATLLGPCRVLPQEYPNLRCVAIDVDAPASGWQRVSLAERVLAEIAADGQGELALRGPERWARTFEPAAVDGSGAALREGGHYVVIGGFGTIGYAHARFLADSGRRLTIVSRSGVDERRLGQVRALEALGAEVEVVAADAGDPAQLGAAFDRARARFGAIHGVVLAAGVVDAGLFRGVRDTDAAHVAAIFGPRVAAVRALADVLAGDAPDFVHVASSLASVLGGLGLAAYASATSFLDAFAQAQRYRSPTAWTSVGWDGWVMEVGSGPADSTPITADEGARVFGMLLGGEIPGHVGVSTHALAGRLARWERKEAAPVETATDTSTLAPRPPLANAYVAPEGALEARIAAIWSEVLGVANVGACDNFFELGGNSLTGVRLITKVRESLAVTIPTVALYEDPTVRALATMIGKQSAPPDASFAPVEDDDAGDDRGTRRRARRAARLRGDDAA